VWPELLLALTSAAPCVHLSGDPASITELRTCLAGIELSEEATPRCLHVQVDREERGAWWLALDEAHGSTLRTASTASIAAALIESWATEPADVPRIEGPAKVEAEAPIEDHSPPRVTISVGGAGAGTLESAFFGATTRVGVFVGDALIFADGHYLYAPPPDRFGVLGGDDVAGLLGVGWVIGGESARATPALAIGVGHYRPSFLLDPWAYVGPGPTAITSLRLEASISASYVLARHFVLEGRALLGLFPTAIHASTDPLAAFWLWGGDNVIGMVSLGAGLDL
jgi:hypothetical protein